MRPIEWQAILTCAIVSVPRTADGGLLLGIGRPEAAGTYPFQCRERLMGDCYYFTQAGTM